MKKAVFSGKILVVALLPMTLQLQQDAAEKTQAPGTTGGGTVQDG